MTAGDAGGAGTSAWSRPWSTASACFVSDAIDNNTNKQALDDIVDAMVSQLLSTPHLFGSNTTFDRVTAADTLVQVGETVYTAIAVTMSDLVDPGRRLGTQGTGGPGD